MRELMSWDEYERRVIRAVSIALEGRGYIHESTAAELWALLDRPFVPELLGLLKTPPPVCTACAKPFRGVLGTESTCFECRQKAERAALKEQLRAEVRAEEEARHG